MNKHSTFELGGTIKFFIIPISINKLNYNDYFILEMEVIYC